MSSKTNEPAFPVEVSWHPDGTMHGKQTGNSAGMATGLTMRDYFAAKAMQTIFDVESEYTIQARDAYAMADAMLAERQKESR